MRTIVQLKKIQNTVLTNKSTHLFLHFEDVKAYIYASYNAFKTSHLHVTFEDYMQNKGLVIGFNLVSVANVFLEANIIDLFFCVTYIVEIIC